jgi:hypothetical protein
MRDSNSYGRTRPVSPTSALPGDGSDPLSVDEWLASPHLSGIVYHLAQRHQLPRQDILELLQEVRMSLIRKGLNSRVNATWVFKTISPPKTKPFADRRGLPSHRRCRTRLAPTLTRRCPAPMTCFLPVR